MKLNFNLDGLAVPVDLELFKQLETLVEKENIPEKATSLVFNFRDKSYSADAGGYHPVEIRIYLEDQMWNIDYITDFSFQGGVFSELAAEVDFDFRNNRLSVSFVPPMPITADIDFFNLWMGNFFAYLNSGAFDEIAVGWDSPIVSKKS